MDQAVWMNYSEMDGNDSSLEVSTTAPPLIPSMDLWIRIIWDLLFIIIIFVSICGNLMVLWIILGHSYMWTVPNAFIANMSFSDLLMAVLNCIFNYIFMRDRHWEFGSAYCSVNNFVAIVTVAASVLNLTAMSIDRYKAIVWPLKARTSKHTVFVVVVFIWVGSALFALPAGLFSTTVENSSGRIICLVKWPDGQMGTSYQDYVYNILIMVVTYILPILIISFSTCHMSIVLWCKQPVGVITPQLERVKKKKQKIVKMLVVLILIFGLCWLPYHIYFIYSYHNPEVMRMENIQHIFLAFYWFAMTHSLVNPIVYYCMNSTFRRYYVNILTLDCLKRRYQDAPAGVIMASALGLQMATQITATTNQQQSQRRPRQMETAFDHIEAAPTPKRPIRPSSTEHSVRTIKGRYQCKTENREPGQDQGKCDSQVLKNGEVVKRDTNDRSIYHSVVFLKRTSSTESRA